MVLLRAVLAGSVVLVVSACSSGGGSAAPGQVSFRPEPGDNVLPADTKVDAVACKKIRAIIDPVAAGLPAKSAPLSAALLAQVREAATGLQSVTSTSNDLRTLLGGLAIDLAQLDRVVKAGSKDGGPAVATLRKDLKTLDTECPR